jgi:hypothetical protein
MLMELLLMVSIYSRTGFPILVPVYAKLSGQKVVAMLAGLLGEVREG